MAYSGAVTTTGMLPMPRPLSWATADLVLSPDAEPIEGVRLTVHRVSGGWEARAFNRSGEPVAEMLNVVTTSVRLGVARVQGEDGTVWSASRVGGCRECGG